MNENFNKMPPIGVTPKYIHDLIRLKDISRAITEYVKDGRTINPEWVEEYNELASKYANPWKEIGDRV